MKRFKKIILFSFIIISISSFSQTKTKDSTNNCSTNQNIKIKTFKIDKGWGFDIYLDNKLFIHQTNIPAINGNKLFAKKKDALKIAKLMKYKICRNIIPPSISIKEINNLLPKYNL